ncbi:MAG: hypothetical protein GFH27_549281n392 [Chloroflexi bacterium AL-W]|nr:hypothetical protein [Chloroflexi bacterium AL-N1]NOK66278.1 hypothetical protein [Chloroflexi bacterium AL-N10]NOK73158.1 hypothetical protein [Chloroflexi bacterium AL-N5]NOK80055.1 hypothetical protein [Chloroflexi bacterium AL-W]NOK88090.1 hypothetical protein [Chloroflexi bacterium AL-N15]
MILEWLWNWLLITCIVIGASLGIQLQWSAIPWLLLVFAGIGWAIWLGVVLPLLVLRYVLPHWRGALPLVAVLSISIIALGSAFPPSDVHPPAPVLAAVVLLMMLILGLGSLAGRIGRLYEAVFVFNQSRSHRQTVNTLPGIAWVITWLSRGRNLTSALLVRGLRSQSRNRIGWLRLIMLCVYMSAFPFAFAWLAPLGLPDTLVVFGYLSTLVLLMIIDGMSSPFGSEGNRLALYLTAPLDYATLLWAKMIAFGLPLLILGYLMLLCMGVWIQLNSEALLQVGLLFTVLLAGITTLFVCGSAIDVNLHLGIEGATQILLYEGSPVTPQRLALASLAVLLVTAQLVIVWQYIMAVSTEWMRWYWHMGFGTQDVTKLGGLRNN